MSAYRLYVVSELGPDGYPPEWHEVIKHEVRELAGNRCVRCGHPYVTGQHGTGEWSRCDFQCSHADPIRFRPIFTDEWREWPIAEIAAEPEATAGALVTNLAVPMFVEARWRILTVHHLDNDKANCRWWNLAALCQRCHLEIQGRVRMQQVYPYEHSEWMKPYAAGFYAHVYLGENLTRSEVEERLDDLLALERVA